ncbi:Hypothetical_protein [Hexamita inflata]|uniref:Hypothetical_protein n=1 Tax=Hexamita inflata TaxID=28002 RepID=A0ABP1HWP1_9EUKA
MLLNFNNMTVLNSDSIIELIKINNILQCNFLFPSNRAELVFENIITIGALVLQQCILMYIVETPGAGAQELRHLDTTAGLRFLTQQYRIVCSNHGARSSRGQEQCIQV